ncbi:MAG TPA: hypothetical protein VFD53_05260 [Ilumatobacter sp.]|jgi:hypothetical protein|nr:hypothetical protein [Ilumatobacter sp.]
MTDVQTQINRLVASFVDQVTALARQAAMDTLAVSMGKSGGRRGAGPAAVLLAGVPGRGRGKGVKRSSSDLERVGEKLLAFVGANPGLRIEQINKAIGTSTRDLQLPIRKMIASGALKTKGQKRSTQYFAGEAKPRKKKGS